MLISLVIFLCSWPPWSGPCYTIHYSVGRDLLRLLLEKMNHQWRLSSLWRIQTPLLLPYTPHMSSYPSESSRPHNVLFSDLCISLLVPLLHFTFASHTSLPLNYTPPPSQWRDGDGSVASHICYQQHQGTSCLLSMCWHRHCQDVELHLSQLLGVRRLEQYLNVVAM